MLYGLNGINLKYVFTNKWIVMYMWIAYCILYWNMHKFMCGGNYSVFDEYFI